MPRERLSLRNVREILRLRWAMGLSQRAIGQSCGLGSGAVCECPGDRVKIVSLLWFRGNQSYRRLLRSDSWTLLFSQHLGLSFRQVGRACGRDPRTACHVSPFPVCQANHVSSHLCRFETRGICALASWCISKLFSLPERLMSVAYFVAPWSLSCFVMPSLLLARESAVAPSSRVNVGSAFA